jgi:hypothetical protein
MKEHTFMWADIESSPLKQDWMEQYDLDLKSLWEEGGGVGAIGGLSSEATMFALEEKYGKEKSAEFWKVHSNIESERKARKLEMDIERARKLIS